MTYSISVTGHGATGDSAVEAFENLVRALRTVNAAEAPDAKDGTSTTPYLSGSITGTGSDGVTISKSVDAVEDTAEFETDEVEEDDDNEEDDNDQPDASTDG